MTRDLSPDTSQFPAAVRSPLRRDIEAGIQGRGMCIETQLSHGLQGVSGGSLSKAGNLLLKMRKVGAYPLVVSIQQMAAPSSMVANQYQPISMVANHPQ